MSVLLRYTILIGLPIVVSLMSCSGFKKQDQGLIYYDVSFPFLENSVLKNVFPEEMTMSCKNGLVKGELKSLGGIVASGFIGNENDRVLLQLFKSYHDHYVVQLDEKGVERYKADQPKMRLEATGKTEMVAGYLCDVTMAHFESDSTPSITLYHTDEIAIDNPNWFTQYDELDGVLLGYEIEQFGMRMKLRAREVIFSEVNDDTFRVDEAYALISPNEMRERISDLLHEYMD